MSTFSELHGHTGALPFTFVIVQLMSADEGDSVRVEDEHLNSWRSSLTVFDQSRLSEALYIIQIIVHIL